MGTRALAGLVLAVLAILPAATDLHPLLASPPSADWHDFPPASTRLVGDFTGHDYAAYRGAGSQGIEFDLNLYGFTRGFALEWWSSYDLLAERVFEFRDARGARSWYTLLGLIDKTSDYTRDIPMPASVPNSRGAVLTLPDGTLQDWIMFRKGNLTFEVITDSPTNDLAALGVAQAVTEYANAPSQTEVPPGSGQAVNDVIRNIGIAVGALVVAVALVITITIVLVTRRRRPATFLLSGPTMSADGAYWWDGQRWRDATIEAPPTAPRSPDGAHWWDGRSWRPLR